MFWFIIAVVFTYLAYEFIKKKIRKRLFLSTVSTTIELSSNTTFIYSPEKIDPKYLSKMVLIGSPIQEVNNKCPYCKCLLAKAPAKKKQCQNCKNYIRVRTRPQDKIQVLVTEDEALEIDEQWQIINGTYQDELAKREEFEKLKTELTIKRGVTANDHDVQWALYNKDLERHAKNKNFGYYRNTRLRMAQLLISEDKKKPALDILLEICYFDVNGSENFDYNFDNDTKKFNPKNVYLPPNIINKIIRLNDNLKLSLKEFENLFVTQAVKFRSWKLEITPDYAWEFVEKEIKDQKS